MADLTEEEVLIVRVATATCLCSRLAPAETDAADVELYVGELLRLYALKPGAVLAPQADSPDDLVSAIGFCAEQLAATFPAYAAKLRGAVPGN